MPDAKLERRVSLLSHNCMSNIISMFSAEKWALYAEGESDKPGADKEGLRFPYADAARSRAARVSLVGQRLHDRKYIHDYGPEDFFAPI